MGSHRPHLITVDQQIWKLDDESRNDHRNALLVKDGFSYWIKRLPYENVRCGRHSIVLVEIPASMPNTQEEPTQTIQGSSSNRARTHNGPIRLLLTVQKPSSQTEFDESTKEQQRAMVQSGLSEDLWECAMECYCLRTMRDNMADGKTAFEGICGVTYDGSLIPFGANVSYQPMSPDESVKRCVLENIWAMSCVWEGAGQVTFSSRTAKTWKTCQSPKFTDKGANTKRSHKTDRLVAKHTGCTLLTPHSVEECQVRWYPCQRTWTLRRERNSEVLWFLMEVCAKYPMLTQEVVTGEHGILDAHVM